MLNFYLRKSVLTALISVAILASTTAYSAVTLDRTRVIFPGTEKSVNITITNDNPSEAYLAQTWIEDMQGHKLTQGAIIATPPLQRMEPKTNALIRLSTTPLLNSLPQDKESVFYFNVREIPPRATDSNTLQIALQSRVKLFYRPAAIVPEAETKWAQKITLTKTATGYRLNNVTPFHLTVIGIGNDKKSSESSQFSTIMIAPKSTQDIASGMLSTPHITYINDYGGKPTIEFSCKGDTCTATGEK
ncbi:molecular chaperone [Morganella psychrotolerans]|uniref:Fimbrial protein n=1 Tax=Morganella psychrotolerans TaxID=368603 RepID=A0A1B8GZF4_9GAMM|nr:fimbria/pilus periplasmic chaperone [Morganella psychrotolerans]OBU02201.1 fimbrial protein [Morganella psychrotolerans]